MNDETPDNDELERLVLSNPEAALVYVRGLKQEIQKLLFREKALRMTATYLSHCIDETGIGPDEDCLEFLVILSKALRSDRTLEHIEADCELLQLALNKRNGSK